MEKYFAVNTTENETYAKNAEVLLFVNTIDNETPAKNAEVLLFVNTIQYETPAKNAKVLLFVNTTEDEASAKNAEVVLFVNTTEDEASAKNANNPKPNQMKLSEAYDKMVDNENIPREVITPVFKIMNDCSRGKYTEQQAREEVQRLMNAMQASANYLINLLEE